MVQKITGEAPFQVLATNFSISPSTEGYTLQISADGVNYTDLFAVGANVTRMVTGVANGSYYRLSGNNSTVSINWRSQCTDGQSGGGGGEGSQGPMGPMGPQGVQGPAGSGEAGDSHILKVSSSAPSGLSEGDVYALHADGSPREIGSDWTDTGEVSYEWYEDYPQAVAIPLNSSEYFSVRFPYEDITTWRGDNGVTVENGELTMENINGWESDGENSYVLIDSEWMDRTSGASIHVFLDNDVLYFYSDDVNRIWMAGIAEPSDEDHTISTGEITPAVPETMGVYQYNDGTVVELATKDDIPAKINLVPNGEPNYGNILQYNDRPEWVHPSNITNAQLINIGTDAGSEDKYPQVLTQKSQGEFLWSAPEKKLEAVSALPTTYVDGAVYALANASGYGVYQTQSGTSEMTWVHFDANTETIPTGWTQARVPYNDDGESNLVGLHINNCDDEVNLYWHPEEAENKHWDGVDGEQNDGEFTMTDSCGNSISCVRNGDYLVLTFSDPVVYVGETWNHTELYVEGIVPNYVKIGEGGGAGDFIHLDNPSTSGETGKTYEYQERLMAWNPNSGNVAEWLKRIDQTQTDEGTGLIFSVIPDGQKLFEYKRSNDSDTRYVIYSGGTLYMTDSASTVLCAVTVGNTFIFETAVYGNIRRIKGIYKNGYIGFQKTEGLAFQNIWDGSVSGGHYELIEKHNHPYLAIERDSGIPEWDKDGNIIRRAYTTSTKDYYVNATGNSVYNRTTVLTNGTNNGPSRFFAPETGGSAGQVLISNGENAAPVWTNWVKPVKITSAAYEALVVKDPNTLYLIID